MKTVGIIVAIGLLIGAFVYTSNRADPATETASPVETQTTTTEPTTSQSSTTPGAYVDYSDTIITQTTGTKILFFHAPWCPQCRALDASIRSGPVPSGVTIIKVDYDTTQKLRQQYGVTIQTTLVKIDDSGALVKKYVAYEEPTLKALKANLL